MQGCALAHYALATVQVGACALGNGTKRPKVAAIQEKPERKCRKTERREGVRDMASKKKWIEELTAACKSVGTYKPEFDVTIRELAEILEEKDRITSAYRKQGRRSVVPYVNKAGAENMVANPLLKQITDLKKLSLPYLRDLGLTSAGLKKLKENALKDKRKSALGEALMSIGG